MNKRVLVVDDEEIQANIIGDILEKEGYSVKKAYSAEEALRHAPKGEYGVLLVDLKMPGMGGIGLLKQVKERGIGGNLIVMTAYGTIETAVEAMKEGAYDYLTKPFSKDELLINVGRAFDAYRVYRQNLHLRDELRSLYEEKALVGNSDAMKGVYDLINKVAASDTANVLITGESGTGKELVAREIHRRSARADMPFLPVNCSAIPETLLESELFGHVKGAFTGAVSGREGKFKKASGGTIFLDEIADMPLSMQVKLLRVIQDKEVTPVGGDEGSVVDVRIVSATNREIRKMVERGEFREDLYYRLNVIPIHIPPLKERREDIPELVGYIMEKLNRKLKKDVSSMPAEVLEQLAAYRFPGNIRELENMLERAFILAGSDELKIEHFPMLTAGREASGDSGAVTGGVEAADSTGSAGGAGTGSAPDGRGVLKDASRRARNRAEAAIIENTLKETSWNRVKAAKILKIDYKTLRTKIAEFNIHQDSRERNS
jgi:DNA-binding NtrC family response regulator